MGSVAVVHSSGGQNHDRIEGPNMVGAGVGSGDGADSVFDITAGQKMIAAMSGSLFTSLLGRSFVDHIITR